MFAIAIAAATAHPADRYVSLSTLTGAMLATECAKDRGLQTDLCTSYILGVSDALQLHRKTCRPQSEASTLQTVTIARRYIAEHPEKWGMGPVFLVQEALVSAFPCRLNLNKP
jgi:hypothetical protein